MSLATPQPPLPADEGSPGTGGHVCPWWVGYLLANPLRRLVEDPAKLLAPHVAGGMTVLDVGCAMGYFSLPMARMVGSGGRVVCVDVQERMLRVLERRARRRGLERVVETRLCSQDDFGVEDLVGKVHVVVAFHVVHEMHNPALFFSCCRDVLRPGGKLVLAEPVHHVSADVREKTYALAAGAGFVRLADVDSRGSKGAIYARP